MSAPDDRPREAAPTERVSYRWTCPYCGASRTCRGDDAETVLRRAETAVQNHTCATAERGHGPRHVVPEDFHPAAQHLERIPG